MGRERLPQRVMFGELVGGKGYSGGQEKDWMGHLKEDMSVFGMKFEGWRKSTQKAGRWFRRVEKRAEFFIRKWHETERREPSSLCGSGMRRRDAELQSDAQRPQQRYPPWTSLTAGGRGEGRGGELRGGEGRAGGARKG